MDEGTSYHVIVHICGQCVYRVHLPTVADHGCPEYSPNVVHLGLGKQDGADREEGNTTHPASSRMSELECLDCGPSFGATLEHPCPGIDGENLRDPRAEGVANWRSCHSFIHMGAPRGEISFAGIAN